GLESLDIEVFKPVKVMLALKVRDVHEGFERCGKEIDAEYKLDGFRIQAHKDGKKIMLFTRRLENVTNQFPDVVESIQSHISGRSFIIDCEAAGFDPKTGRYIPFQNISQRIRRKYSIGETAEEFPVEVNVFDVLYYDGASLINKHFIERRALLEKCIKPAKRKLVAVRNLISSSEKSVEQFYKESLKAGNEGIMIKALDAPYKPGARVGYMNKLKPVMDTLDLAIVGAEWGEGKRSQWLSSFTLACRDEDGNFLEIGKVGTGIKEKEDLGVSFEQLTSLLKPLILEEQGKVARVKPKIVVEVKFEEIQKSPTYGSGYALRFPRLVQIREERDAEDCSTLDVVEESFRGQK
ncbi:ATP-dependent DNA ligase, partial [Candidatus Woesearchaeota archaeon]|nr:ATP-dependent DNA ligase [Candidatus Woesearchaeota archaeon]